MFKVHFVFMLTLKLKEVVVTWLTHCGWGCWVEMSVTEASQQSCFTHVRISHQNQFKETLRGRSCTFCRRLQPQINKVTRSNKNESQDVLTSVSTILLYNTDIYIWFSILMVVCNILLYYCITLLLWYCTFKIQVIIFVMIG